MSLLSTLRETPAILSPASKYTVVNGLIYLSLGALLIVWPGAVQTIFRDRPFVGNESGLMRAIGLTVVVIGWLYLFGGRSGGAQTVAASVIDRLIFVPVVAFPLALSGVFPHLLIAFALLDMSLAVGAWILLHRAGRPQHSPGMTA